MIESCCCPQHDGKPFCHKPCYAALFGPKGARSLHYVTEEMINIFFLKTKKKKKTCFIFCVAGVNIGGAGSYVYDNPTNDAQGAGSLETDGKPQEEEKKASARGPVKGETSTTQEQKIDEACQA